MSRGPTSALFHFSLTCLVLVLTLLALGCSGAKVTTQASSELPRYQVHTMALLPFSAMETPQVRDAADQYMSTPRGARASDISVAIPSTVESPVRQTVTVPPYAAEKITQLFWVRLRNRKDITVLAPSDAVKAAPPVDVGTAEVTPESAAAQVAKSLRADAVLMGKVLVYQERVGSRLGADPPATVGFEVKAVAPDGHVLWVANYYEKQKPITADFMGSLQHGGGFVTADELAHYGVESIMKKFPFGSAED